MELRAAEQQEQEYLREQPEDTGTRDDLGPAVPLSEDWMCRWCGEINRRRLNAEHAASCRRCFASMKPCAECGGPVKDSEQLRAAKPPTICRECWRMDSPVLFRQIAKAERKLKRCLEETVARRDPRTPAHPRSKPLTKPKRPVVVPQRTRRRVR